MLTLPRCGVVTRLCDHAGHVGCSPGKKGRTQRTSQLKWDSGPADYALLQED
jgi:hypothetical protein